MQQFVILFYYFVCILILLYTIGYVFFQAYRIKKQGKDVEKNKKVFSQQKQLLDLHGYIERDHLQRLAKRFRKTNQLLAFDKTLRELEQEQVELYDYLGQLEPMVSQLVEDYRDKDQMEQAYLAWFIASYSKYGWKDPSIYEALLAYDITGKNIYLRENILTAVYRQQNIKFIIRAFRILTKNNLHHHSKLIQDGLLHYPGDKKLLAEELWEQHETFNPSIVEGIIRFITVESENFQERFYELLENEAIELEIKTIIMRYFRRHPYKKAEGLFISFTRDDQDVIRIVATQVLSAYPSKEVVAALKQALSDPNWYVRHNASQSLVAMEISATTIHDVLAGDDHFAKEIFSYHLNKEGGVNT